MSTSSPSHPSPSSSALPTQHSPRNSTATSRLMVSVRRTLTPAGHPKRKTPDMSSSGMYSTLEERNPHPQPRFRDNDPTTARPTIEQIAMGLHVSRTPHLRPLGSSQYSYPLHAASHSGSSPHHRSPSTPISLPPPPARSSMKKQSTRTSSSDSPKLSPRFSAETASSTTVTSQTLSSAHPSRSLTSLKVRMARFLPGARTSSAPASMLSSPIPSPRESGEFPQTKKAVRFSTSDGHTRRP